MELLYKLNESVELELIDIHEDVLTFMESCTILESDSKKMHKTALSFLTTFVDEIKHDTVGAVTSNATKQKFSLFTVLELLLKSQKHDIDQIPSVKRYMHSDAKISDDELTEAEKTLKNALSKLKGDNNTPGAKIKDENISLFADDKDSFLKRVQSVKNKYSRMSRKI